MAWNHDDVSPNRSRDELLGEVVRRGEGLRRRRRLVGGLGGGLALVLAVGGVAAVVGSGDDRVTNLAAGGPTTTAAAFGPATGGTVFAVDAPTTTAGPEATTVTTRRAVVTTLPPAPEPTVVTTSPPAPPTTVAVNEPQCSAAQVEVTLAFPKSTYAVGEPVVGQASVRNRSGAPCYYFSYTQSMEFRNAGGTPVSPGSTMIADAFRATPLAPGQALGPAAVSWDQRACDPDPACPQAPPGTYTGFVSWSFDGPPIAATASFAIVP